MISTIKLLILFVGLTAFPVFSQITPIPPKISNEYQKALLENPDYNELKIKIEALQKREKEFALNYFKDNPTQKRQLDEYYKIQAILAKPDDLSTEQRAKYSNRLFLTLRKEFQDICSKSPDLAKMEAEKHIIVLQLGMIMFRINHQSTDSRIIAYNHEQQKYMNAYFAEMLKKQAKSDVAGSEEFKAAMHGAELYKQDPAKHKWAMINGLSRLRTKVEDAAQAIDPKLKELACKRTLSYLEMNLRTARINLNNIAAYQETLTSSPSAMQSRLKLQKIYNKDTEYRRLRDASMSLSMQYQQALETFIAKSHLPVVDEYRKFKAIMGKISPAKSSTPICCPAPQKLDFSNLFQKTKYLRKDYKARESAMFNKYLQREQLSNKAAAEELFKSPDEKKLTAFLKSNDLTNSPVTEFFLRTQYFRQNRLDVRNLLKIYPLTERIIAANPTDRNEGQIVLNRIAHDYRRYPQLINSLEKISKMPQLDIWLKEMLSGHAAKWKGWRSRGHGFAARVSANGWKSFDKQLKIAKDHYLKALEIAPDRPEPAVALAGSPYPQSEALKYYRIAAQIEADNQSAAVGLLNCFRPRGAALQI